MNLQTVRAYAKAMRYGSKYIYETVPRMLTIWLDLGDDAVISKDEIYRRLNGEVSRALKTVPTWKVCIVCQFCPHVNSSCSGILPSLRLFLELVMGTMTFTPFCPK